MKSINVNCECGEHLFHYYQERVENEIEQVKVSDGNIVSFELDKITDVKCPKCNKVSKFTIKYPNTIGTAKFIPKLMEALT